MVGNVCLSETRRQEVVGEPGVISVCMCGCRGVGRVDMCVWWIYESRTNASVPR